MKFGKALAAALTVALLGAACGGNDHKVATRRGTSTTRRTTTTACCVGDATTTTSAAAAPTTTTAHKSSSSTAACCATATTTASGGGTTTVPKFAAVKMATLTRPIALATRAGDANTVYIAQKGGIVTRLRVGASSATVDPLDILNITDRVSTGDEQGLLGLAFSQDGATMYVDYTDVNGDTQIVAYPYSGGHANANGGHTVLAIPHPQYPNHNAGELTFGSDGYLYIGTGDGGGAGDPFGNAQNLGSLRGKILRIAPNPNGGYSVPADNPFVHTAGAKGEIWQFGLRNPWRWSFDRKTGEQWIGDVGQNLYEEVDHVGSGVRGVNFGWNQREAKHPYNGGAMPPGAVDPELEVPHTNGSCAIVGGYVYRGARIPALAGTYLFTDNCRGTLVADIGGVARDAVVSVSQPSSFGEDASGELWVLSLTGPVFRLGPVS
ncbi:MAG TPA: PQQ-dependent sugar dehydrogenase [Acidimicrobiales bacterium]|nr:PQQ-dependent sugar dehydrogenase [Acidimicrobiales bacterium]